MDSAALRKHVESVLRRRVCSPFTYRQQELSPETASSGVAELDRTMGGVPRGALTEVCGHESSGRTTLLISMLAEIAAAGEACALVDGSDALDPHSLHEGGMDPKSLLWVRCRNIEQAVRSTDLLLQAGGFGMVAVDLAEYSSGLVRHIPLSTWFRFRRAVENTRTVFVVLEQQPTARTCASLILGLESNTIHWSTVRRSGDAGSLLDPPKLKAPELTHTRLLCGARVHVQVSRSRLAVSPAIPARFDTKAGWSPSKACG